MNINIVKKLISCLIAAVLILCVLPFGVFAAQAQVQSVVCKMEEDFIPKAGERIKWSAKMFSIPYGRMYHIYNTPSRWENDVVSKVHDYDESHIYYDYYDFETVYNSKTGTNTIPGDPVFEAGRTYHLALYFEVDQDMQSKFYFGDRIADYDKIDFKISNLPDSSYTVEIKRSLSSRYIMWVIIGFKIPGQKVCKDIENVTVYEEHKESGVGEFFPIKPGYYCDGPTIYPGFGNFRREHKWIRISGNDNKQFVAGESYIKQLKFYADEGYKFSPGVTADFLSYDFSPSKLELSKDRKTLTVEYIFTVENFDKISVINVQNSKGEYEIIPAANAQNTNPSGAPITYFSLKSDAGCHFANSYGTWDNATWHDEKGTHYISGFEKGYVYHFTLEFVSDNSKKAHFANNVDINIENVPKADYIEVPDTEYNDANPGIYRSTFYFISGDAAHDYGKSADKPVECNTFEGLQFALSRPEIKYVRLNGGGSKLSMPLVATQGKPTKINGITVAGEKVLMLNGTANFVTPSVDPQAYCEYQYLIDVPAGAALTVQGDGELIYKASITDGVNNSVIYNQGYLVVNSGTVTGDTVERDVNAFAIYNARGDLIIKDGRFNSNNSTSDTTSGAVKTVGGKTVISGGVFKPTIRSELGGAGDDYGLFISGDANVTEVVIDGGTYYGAGIKFGLNVTRLSTYCSNSYHRVYLNEITPTSPSEITKTTMNTVSRRPLKVAKYINAVEVKCQPPIVNSYLSIYPEVITDKVNVASVDWYKDGVKLNYPNERQVEEGASYRVEIQLTGDADKWVNIDDYQYVTAKINGTSVDVTKGNYNRNGIKISYDFGVSSKSLFDLRVDGFTMPVEHAKPKTTVPSGDSTNYTFGNIQWYKNGVAMSTSEEFATGNKYSVEFDAAPRNSNVFMFNDEGNPMAVCVINDEVYCDSVTVSPKNSKYARFHCDFGELPDTVIEQINIQFDQPGDGDYPVYNARSLDSRLVMSEDGKSGKGYDLSIDSNGNLFNNYYAINGMTYYDITDGGHIIVHETDTLIAGHKYCVYFKVLTANDNYKFYSTNYYSGSETKVTASVNGNAAIGREIYNPIDDVYQVCYEFVCEKPVISALYIRVPNEPVDGNEIDTYSESAEPELYTVRQGFWLNSDDFTLSIGNVFEAGRLYKYKAIIDAAACEFAPEVTVLINGETAYVEVDGDTVTAFGSFLCAEKPAYIPGDINDDGKVNNKDLTRLFQKLSGWNVEVVEAALDVNGDSKVNNKDLTRLFQYLSGWNVQIS